MHIKQIHATSSLQTYFHCLCKIFNAQCQDHFEGKDKMEIKSIRIYIYIYVFNKYAKELEFLGIL